MSSLATRRETFDSKPCALACISAVVPILCDSSRCYLAFEKLAALRVQEAEEHAVQQRAAQMGAGFGGALFPVWSCRC